MTTVTATAGAGRAAAKGGGGATATGVAGGGATAAATGEDGGDRMAAAVGREALARRGGRVRVAPGWGAGRRWRGTPGAGGADGVGGRGRGQVEGSWPAGRQCSIVANHPWVGEPIEKKLNAGNAWAFAKARSTFLGEMKSSIWKVAACLEIQDECSRIMLLARTTTPTALGEETLYPIADGDPVKASALSCQQRRYYPPRPRTRLVLLHPPPCHEPGRMPRRPRSRGCHRRQQTGPPRQPQQLLGRGQRKAPVRWCIVRQRVARTAHS